MNELSIIPKHELPDFSRYPDECKREVRRLMNAMARLVACAGRGIGSACAEEAAKFDISAKRMRTIYDAYLVGGWRALINRRKFPDPAENLPFEFLEFWKTLCEENKRKSEPASRELIRGWRTGYIMRRGKKVKLDSIPGYKERPEAAPGKDHPTGWSYRNLLRHAPTRFEIVAARIGADAAAAHRPLVYTGRKGLWVASHYMFDDLWHDLFVNTFVEKQHGRPLELFSHDLCSARKVRWGIRVRTRKEDGSYQGLAERMTRMILTATLFLDGYSLRGTVLVAEHGTAAIPGATYERDREIIREGLDLMLWEASGGLITVERSGMQGAAAAAGQYSGISKGNPRRKASLESSNYLVHNEFAALPALTGKDVATRPEELHGLLKHNAALLAAYDQLSPSRRERLDFPMLEVNQFLEVAQDIYANIENYTEHDLVDWEECGHVVNEFLFDNRWVDQRAIMNLEPEVRAMFETLIESGKVQTRPRRMSRREVWDAGAGELVKLSGFGVVAILGEDLGVERKMRDGMFQFADAEVGPGIHRFYSRAIDAYGAQIELPEGAYKTFVNPFAPDTLFVCDLKGGYIGECSRTRRAQNDDPQAVARACGAAEGREAEMLEPFRKRGMDAAREKLARHKNNARVVGDAPITPEEKEVKRREPEVRAASNDKFSKLAVISRKKRGETPEDITQPQ